MSALLGTGVMLQQTTGADRSLNLALLLMLLTFCLGANAGGIFQYTDKDGRVVFSDRQPAKQQDVRVIDRQPEVKGAEAFKLFVRKLQDGQELVAYNPFYAPVELVIKSSAFSGGYHTQLLPANSTTVVYKSDKSIPSFKYRSYIGDPNARQDNYVYRVPAKSKLGHLVTQSFNGRFSHGGQPNTYAVDIAMDIGTYLIAAREGTVIAVKDDYHMSGIDAYFMDKANYIKVLHADGTYAVYAHINQASAMVRPGERVALGQRLARSGSSGYSTGPHLHFVIWKNTGRSIVSVPFKFINGRGETFTPQRGMQIGYR